MVTDSNYRPKAFLCGPRGPGGFEKSEFDTAAELAFSKGYEPVNPRELDLQASPSDESRSPDQERRRRMLRYCSELLSLRAEKGDVVVLLDGWEENPWATFFAMVARCLNLPLYTDGNYRRTWYFLSGSDEDEYGV
jgi:hypothetical protein